MRGERLLEHSGQSLELQRDVRTMRAEVLVGEDRFRQALAARDRRSRSVAPASAVSDASQQASIGATAATAPRFVRRRLERLGRREKPGGVLVEFVRGIATTRRAAARYMVGGWRAVHEFGQ